MKKITLTLILLLSFIVAFNACDKDDDSGNDRVVHIIELGDNAEADFQETLINLNDEEVIQFKAGTYHFTNTISGIDVKNATIIGAGMNETILDFSGQTAGAQGLKLDNMDGLLLANLTVQDAIGDNVKIKGCNGVSLINVGGVYTGEPDETNGAYALYPVECENVLVQGCYVRGASDAGIYVGQSKYVEIKDNFVEYCVAGIEVENCLYSDVYNNETSNNTGGILVFDLPGLEIISQGGFTRVFDNNVHDNNYRNFAPEGNIVGTVPPGTGLMILASRDCEIFNNNFDRNNMMGIAIVSYETISYVGGGSSDDPNYDPYTYLISIHDNSFTRGTEFPADGNSTSAILTSLVFPTFDDATDIIYDGFTNANVSAEDQRICLNNNTNGTAANLDFPSFPSLNITYGLEQFSCTIDPLDAVTVNAPTLADRGF